MGGKERGEERRGREKEQKKIERGGEKVLELNTAQSKKKRRVRKREREKESKKRRGREKVLELNTAQWR